MRGPTGVSSDIALGFVTHDLIRVELVLLLALLEHLLLGARLGVRAVRLLVFLGTVIVDSGKGPAPPPSLPEHHRIARPPGAVSTG